MSSPRDYLSEIGAIVEDDLSDGAINLNIKWTNRQDGKAALARLRAMQTQLRQLKQSINADATTVRSQFTTGRTAVGKTFGAGLASAFIGRKTVGMFNAAKRDDLRIAQLRALEPYEKAKRLIDEIIQRLNDAKAQIENSDEYQDSRKALPAASEAAYLILFPDGIKGPFTMEQVRGFLLAGVVTFGSNCLVTLGRLNLEHSETLRSLQKRVEQMNKAGGLP